MSRTFRTNETPGLHVSHGFTNAQLATPAHAGHVLKVYADKAIYCDTDDRFLQDTDILRHGF